MSKTILYRLLGIGKIPAEYLPALEKEVIVLSDEGIRGSTTYLNFRSPGRISNWRREWYSASIVLTKTRLAAFRHTTQLIDVLLSDERFSRMRFSIENGNTLVVAFDAALFQNDWSGTLEYRFRTLHAQSFLDKLES